MCHCKTRADRLHVIIVITEIAIPYSLPSCLIGLPILHTHTFRSLFRVFYALLIVHDTSSKNAKLPSVTTLFPWRHINTSKNHGYNTVADNSCRTRNCSLLQRHFPDVTLTAARIKEITLSQMACAGSHFVPGIWHLLPTKKVKKVEKFKHFRTIHKLRSLSDQGRDVCKVWLRSVQKCEFVWGTNKQTNKQTNIQLYI
jgi:hypothetical protein